MRAACNVCKSILSYYQETQAKDPIHARSCVYCHLRTKLSVQSFISIDTASKKLSPLCPISAFTIIIPKTNHTHSSKVSMADGCCGSFSIRNEYLVTEDNQEIEIHFPHYHNFINTFFFSFLSLASNKHSEQIKTLSYPHKKFSNLVLSSNSHLLVRWLECVL